MTDTSNITMPPRALNKTGLNFARDVNATFFNCLSEYQLQEVLNAFINGIDKEYENYKLNYASSDETSRLQSKAARIDSAIVELQSMIDGDSPWDSQISNVIRILEGNQP